MLALSFQRRSSRYAPLCHIARRSALSSLTLHGGSGSRQSRGQSIPSSFSFSNSISVSYATSSSRHSGDKDNTLSSIMTPVIVNNTRELADHFISRLDEKQIKTMSESFQKNRLRCEHKISKAKTNHHIGKGKQKADNNWINEWFERMYKNPELPFYPVTIPPEKGLSEAIDLLSKALRSANKHKNSDFLTNLAEGTIKKESTDINGESSSPLTSVEVLKEDRNDEIHKFISKNFNQTPVAMMEKIASLVTEYVMERATEAVFKKKLRDLSTIHQGFYIGIIHFLGLTSNSAAVENTQKALRAKDSVIDNLVEDIEFIQDTMLKKKSTKEKKEGKIESISESPEESKEKGEGREAFYVAMRELGLPEGSPCTRARDVLEDQNASTQMSSTPNRTKSPQLRKKKVKTEHCLQVTLNCEEFKYQEIYIDPLDDYSDNYNEKYSKNINSGDDKTDSNNIDYNDEYISNNTNSENGSIDHENEINENEKNILTTFDNNSKYVSTSSKERADVPSSMNSIYDDIMMDHKNQENDLWANSHFKIYLENIPEDITMDGLKYAMRNCGDIADAKLYMNRSYGEEDLRKMHNEDDSSTEWLKQYGYDSFSIIKPEKGPPMTMELLQSKYGIKVERQVSKNGVHAALLHRNPLAVLASVRKRILKKQIINLSRTDNTAFLMMSDWKSYDKVTGDDMRIFGVCMNGQNTRVTTVMDMKSLLVEPKACFTVSQIEGYLNTLLGGSYRFELTDSWANMGGHKSANADIAHDINAMPVFVKLNFSRHDLAWDAYMKLMQADDKGAPFAVTWNETRWYKTVKQKANEMNLESVLVEVDSDSKTVKIKTKKTKTSKISETDDEKNLKIAKDLKLAKDQKNSEKQMKIDKVLGTISQELEEAEEKMHIEVPDNDDEDGYSGYCSASEKNDEIDINMNNIKDFNYKSLEDHLDTVSDDSDKRDDRDDYNNYMNNLSEIRRKKN